MVRKSSKKPIVWSNQMNMTSPLVLLLAPLVTADASAQGFWACAVLRSQAFDHDPRWEGFNNHVQPKRRSAAVSHPDCFRQSKISCLSDSENSWRKRAITSSSTLMAQRFSYSLSGASPSARSARYLFSTSSSSQEMTCWRPPRFTALLLTHSLIRKCSRERSGIFLGFDPRGKHISFPEIGRRTPE